MTDRCDPEAESGPDGRVRLVSTSRASDGSFTAISEIGALLRDEQHRLIGGVAIVLHQHRLGLEHPVRSTADADHGAVGGGALSPKSVHAVHAVFHQVLDDAVCRGAAVSNVVASARPPCHRDDDDVVTTWTPDEVRTFLETARGHRLYPVFFVLLATGLTRGELVGLRWGDVDLDAGEITVRRIVSMTNGQRTESTPSPSARRTVSIADRTLRVLSRHQLAVGDACAERPVFEQRNGGELNPESLSAAFGRLVERAGVPPLTIGGLRHTHAALLFRAGVGPLVVSKRLGHSTFVNTQNMYGHLIPPLRDANLAAFEQSILTTQP